MSGSSAFDPVRYSWREVTDSPGDYLVHHDYTILGYDLAAGTLDMIVRWDGDGGHCPIHRHTATTTVLVLDGEQHLWDVAPDGSLGPERVRRAGDYALTHVEAAPHLESGGPAGGLVFFGSHSDDGRLYDIVDDAGNVIVEVTMETLVADWKANT